MQWCRHAVAVLALPLLGPGVSEGGRSLGKYFVDHVYAFFDIEQTDSLITILCGKRRRK